MEKRLLCLPFFLTQKVQKMARDHELQADAYAVREGYGPELMAVVSRHRDSPQNPFYPTIAERQAEIRRLIKEKIYVVTTA